MLQEHSIAHRQGAEHLMRINGICVNALMAALFARELRGIAFTTYSIADRWPDRAKIGGIGRVLPETKHFGESNAEESLQAHRFDLSCSA
jgi:hypothetical protein